jgi:hypothetical protein
MPIAASVGVSGRRLLEPANAASLFETYLAKPWRTYQYRPFTLLLGSTSCGNRPVRRANPFRPATLSEDAKRLPVTGPFPCASLAH